MKPRPDGDSNEDVMTIAMTRTLPTAHRPGDPMKWLRLYTEARTDKKLGSLTDPQFRVWFNLLCMAGEQSDRGVIGGYTEKVLAVEVAGGDVELLRETCNALQSLLVVTVVTVPDSTLQVTFNKFAERQFIRPSETREAVRERVHKFRDRNKLQPEPGKRGPKRKTVTAGNALHAPSETDTELREREDAGTTQDHEDGLPPIEEDGPIGANTAAQVREALYVAREAFPGTSVPTVARQWLTDHAAARVIAAITAAQDAKARRPNLYVAALLDDPGFPRPKAPPASRAFSPEGRPALSPRDEKRRRQDEAMRSVDMSDIPDL